MENRYFKPRPIVSKLDELDMSFDESTVEGIQEEN